MTLQLITKLTITQHSYYHRTFMTITSNPTMPSDTMKPTNKLVGIGGIESLPALATLPTFFYILLKTFTA